MNTNMTRFRWFSEIFASLCIESIASALEGLSINRLVKALITGLFAMLGIFLGTPIQVVLVGCDIGS